MNWLLLPPWSIHLCALGAGVLLAALVLRALRERRTNTLRSQLVPLIFRALVIAVLLSIALNPTSVLPRTNSAQPRLTVLVDTSASMSTADANGRPRLEAALAALKDPGSLRALQREFKLDVKAFDKTVRPVELERLAAASAAGRATDLSAALNTVVSDVADQHEQSGILVLSDGRATRDGTLDSARLALARSVPLWTCCLGGPVPRQDIWLELPASEVLAFAGDDVELNAVLHQTGYEARTFAVELCRDGKVLSKAEARPGADGSCLLKFKAKASASGEERFVLRAVEEPGEADKSNNERSVFVRAVGEKVRVLFVEGQPHWDSKFLVQSLKRNPRVSLTAVYRLGKNRQFAVVSAGSEQRREQKDLFPRSAAEFNAFDIVVLGRGCEMFFDAHTEELLTQFVAQNGGALVLARGKSYSERFAPLAKLDPVVWGPGQSHAMRLAPVAGVDCPAFQPIPAPALQATLQRLPRLDECIQTIGAKPLATVMAEAQSDGSAGESAIAAAWQLYGQGRVMTLNAGGLWRWTFREKGQPEDDLLYDQFWNSTLCWLISGSDFLAGHNAALRTDRRLYTDEQPVRVLVRTRGIDHEAYRPRISIRAAGSQETAVIEPQAQAGGIYTAQAGPFPPGKHEIHLLSNVGTPGDLSLTIESAATSIENRVLSADPDLMKSIAETSGGRTLEISGIGQLGGIVRNWRAQRQLADQKEPLWDRWWLLVLVFGALGAEWYWRRREGLL